MPWKYQNRPINPNNLKLSTKDKKETCLLSCDKIRHIECYECPTPEIVQTLKVIQEFIDCGLYAHEEWRGLSMHGDYECKPDCQVCTLQRELTKDFPELRKWIKKGTRGD